MSSVAAMAAETETGKVRSSAAWCRRGGALAGVVVLHGLVIGALMLAPTAPEVAGGDRAVHHGGAGLAGNGGGTRNSAAAAAGSHGNTANPRRHCRRSRMRLPQNMPLRRRHRSLCLLPRPPFRHPRSRLR
jgi:hypothetical protein